MQLASQLTSIPGRLLCILSLHRWTLRRVLDDRLSEILFGISKTGAVRWQEVCARRGCKATRPVQSQSKSQSQKGPSQ